MDILKKLSLNAQLVLLGSLLYLIVSFLHWVSLGTSFGTYTENEWNGFAGVLAGVLVFALIAWDLARAFDLKVSIGSVSAAFVSVVLGEVLLLATLIKFFNTSYRGWASYVGLVLAIGIGVLSLLRAKEEGVTLPATASSGTGGAAA
jgi:hypothetical protein